MIEMFRPVPGYPNCQASQFGRIKGPSEKVLKQRVNNNGYMEVSPGGKTTTVHKLVLLAWIGPPPPAHECCHGPRGQLCNELTNLRWGTRSENAQDRVRDGNHGKKGPIRAIIREDGMRWQNAAEAARAIGVHPETILQVCHGRRKTCRGYSWRFDTDRFGSVPRLSHQPRQTRTVIRGDGKRWASAREAARAMGVHPTSIYRVCRGERKTCKEYTWRFESS